MYKNVTPNGREYRSEDNPHTPTNLPEKLEEKCHRLFEHTETWSAVTGAVKYVYPKTEDGYNDYVTMLDLMGVDSGSVFEYNGKTKLFVVKRTKQRIRWGKESFIVPDAGVKVLVYNNDLDGERRHYSSGDGYNPKYLWKAYIYDDLKKIGNIKDM